MSIVPLGPTSREVAELVRVHGSAAARASRIVRSLGWDDTRTWVDPNGYRLSDRIWQQRQVVRSRIDSRIRVGIARGDDAIDIARDLERFLNPSLAPRRTVLGRIIKKNAAPGSLAGTPRGGTGSYPARRLARTEVTRAHGQATTKVAERIGSMLKWRLSARHPKEDICDEYAGRDEGFGPGVYSPRSLPSYPPHPQCICTISTHVVETDDELVARLRREFRLDEWDGDVA